MFFNNIYFKPKKSPKKIYISNCFMFFYHMLFAYFEQKTCLNNFIFFKDF